MNSRVTAGLTNCRYTASLQGHSWQDEACTRETTSTKQHSGSATVVTQLHSNLRISMPRLAISHVHALMLQSLSVKSAFCMLNPCHICCKISWQCHVLTSLLVMPRCIVACILGNLKYGRVTRALTLQVQLVFQRQPGRLNTVQKNAGWASPTVVRQRTRTRNVQVAVYSA